MIIPHLQNDHPGQGNPGRRRPPAPARPDLPMLPNRARSHSYGDTVRYDAQYHAGSLLKVRMETLNHFSSSEPKPLPISEARLDSDYINPDLAPTTLAQRTWSLKDLAALWVALAGCVPTYMLASSLIEEGMNWWQAILTICLGNVIVLIPMILNAHPGTRYGIPFPVYCRASFGLRGANVPALLRAVVACGWFGIQAWIGGWAIYQITLVYVPSLAAFANVPGLGISAPQLICFLLFWGINVLVVWRGIDSIRLLLKIKAPLLIVLGLALLAW